MSKTITADDGTKYELVESAPAGWGKNPSYILKPLQPAEEKYTYHLGFRGLGETDNDFSWSAELTPSQASALAEAIKALVEYVTDPSITVAQAEEDTFQYKAAQAWKALHGGSLG